MEKLEREKWESESKAHKWKMDFQDLCQTYEVTGCNKATLYYMSALQLREQIQDNALKRLFIYAICDAGFLMDRYTDTQIVRSSKWRPVFVIRRRECGNC